MFSSRLNWDLRPNPLSGLLDKKRRAGQNILDLTESNPTRAGFNYPREEILDSLADPGALRYDPSPRGLLSAREAIASHWRRPTGAESPAHEAAEWRRPTDSEPPVEGASEWLSSMARDASLEATRQNTIHPGQILLTASTSEAYAYLFKLLCDPGDEILTPRPSYPLFEFLAALESVRVRQYPLRYDGAWRIDFAALEAAITGRTRAIVVVDPNNPTGSFLDPDESDRLQSLAASRGLAILIDEVFLDYRFESPANPTTTRDTSRDQRERLKEILLHRTDPSPADPTPTAPPQALTFHMSGLSKIAGLPQLKLGWIIAEGPNHALALDRLELIADTYLSVSTPVQLALPRLLAASETIRTQILHRAQANLATARSLTAGSACHVLNVEGGWYATLQVPQTRSEEEWALTVLADRDVLIQPGFFFDFESEAFLIVSLITPPEIFAEGIRRIISLAR